jgi:predicted ribosomally synthesized peptide with SipW-like signal peptide
VSVLQKNKKVAAGIGVAAAAAAVLALGAGTYAAFSDTEAGPGGTLAAGTLTLDVTSNAEATTEVFSAENIAPGYTSSPRVVTIANTGTVNGTLSATATVTENTGGDLDDQLLASGNCTGSTVVNFTNLPVRGLGSGFNGLPLPAGATTVCTFSFTFPDRPDNNLAQGDKVEIASTFTLTQASTTSDDS